MTQIEAEREALSKILRALLRNARLILLTTLGGTAAVAFIVLFALTPQYQAVSTILVDSRKTEILKDREVVGRPATDNGAIESEAELMKSPAVLGKVVKALQLDRDAEFIGSGGLLGWLNWLLLAPLKSAFSEPKSEIGDLADRATEILKSKVQASRRNLTYVIELSVWSENGDKAAKIANAIAETYLAEQVGTKNSTVKKATTWLNEEVERLRSRLALSEDAYETYKAEAGLFDPGGLNLIDRQIAHLNEQLVAARARAAEAESRYKQLEQITGDKLKSASSSQGIFQSSILQGLRSQYMQASLKHSELIEKYGLRHPQVIAAKADLLTLSNQIDEELGHMVANAKTEFEIARSREVFLNTSLDELKTSAAQINQRGIKLRQFEREVQANRGLFEAFLSRAKETSAQINMQMPDARILSFALAPQRPSYPRKNLMIGLGFFASLTFAICLILVPAIYSENFYNIIDVQQTFGVKPLATVPLVKPSSTKGSELLGRSFLSSNQAIQPLSLHPVDFDTKQLANFIVQEPDSDFSESINSLYYDLYKIKIRHGISIIAITSALPGEGKSILAANVARAAAISGNRVLLIDADLRRPSILSKLNLPMSQGVLGILKGINNYKQLIIQDRLTPLHVIAGSNRINSSEALGLLTNDKLKVLFKDLRADYDFIIIDTPPLLPVTDGRILIGNADGVILVVASEQTSKRAINAVFQYNNDIEKILIGVVMNKYNNNAQSLYIKNNDLYKAA
ncbi:MAG: polysaccharide biosynthesis tyrosine autokinase [Rhodomicrobium sp.]|nr:polysaccharide biosynthesis tyrosine autokinase [Rhodomicrobium sp.]